MSSADPLSALTRTVKQLSAFNEIAKALTSTLEPSEVLQLVMQKVSELLKPKNWSLLLHDEVSGDLYFEIAVGEHASRLKPLRIRPGEGIAGEVFVSGQPKLVADVSQEASFSPRFDEASQFRTHSVLAVPLTFRGRVLGVIELLGAPNEAGFSMDDLWAASAIADCAAIAISNARNFQRVQELTLTDEHTGLYNTRHLIAQLEREVARAGRFLHRLSLVFLDLDHFKQVNDQHGHLVGSAVLREVGHLIRECIRQVDFPVRYGGDEFAALLVETDVAGALTTAERICGRVRAHTFAVDHGLALKLTASVGVATFPDHAGGAMQLIQAADRVMYRVKASGRNGVQTAAVLGESPKEGEGDEAASGREPRTSTGWDTP